MHSAQVSFYLARNKTPSARPVGIAKNAIRHEITRDTRIPIGAVVKGGKHAGKSLSGTVISINETDGTARVLPYNGMPVTVTAIQIKHFIIPEELFDEKHDQKKLDEQRVTAPINACLAGKGGAKNNEKKLDFVDPRLD
ncbi:hypothetical protein EXVG_00172 [Emiliania huxleyi virus 202]|nr:hypothetical protein EXVG_00172 [Emiliania huxleyi virus 202]AHA54394.1 hypothetical protein EhV18_00348 [Emiliania huxleyi virus 18]